MSAALERQSLQAAPARASPCNRAAHARGGLRRKWCPFLAGAVPFAARRPRESLMRPSLEFRADLVQRDSCVCQKHHGVEHQIRRFPDDLSARLVFCRDDELRCLFTDFLADPIHAALEETRYVALLGIRAPA